MYNKNGGPHQTVFQPLHGGESGAGKEKARFRDSPETDPRERVANGLRYGTFREWVYQAWTIP